MEPSFDPTVFTKNRQRLLKHDVAQQFFDAVVRQAAGLGLLSDEHFTVDGTLIEAAASLKSFRPTDKPRADERLPMILAIQRSTSIVNGARMKRIGARRIPKRLWPRRAKGRKPIWRIRLTR